MKITVNISRFNSLTSGSSLCSTFSGINRGTRGTIGFTDYEW